MAPTEEVIELEPVIREFLPRLVGLNLDDCLITDESSLQDFTDSSAAFADVQSRLKTEYGIDLATLPDDRLVSVARAIARTGV